MIRETVPGDSIYHCLVTTFLRSGGNHQNIPMNEKNVLSEHLEKNSNSF